jgi:hypothetical protein
MSLLLYNQFVKYFFLFIWFFFFIRISFNVDIKKNILQFNYDNWFNFLIDFFSITILLFLIIYFIRLTFINKKIPTTIILILYPICALIGYFNNPELHYNSNLVWHYFITISSLILFFAIIDSFGRFNYHFYELLLKTIILIIAVFFLTQLLPLIITKLYNGIDLRFTYKDSIFLGDFSKIYITQNVNGQARILFILQIFFLILFRKFTIQKKIISNFFFLISISFFSIILLMKSRYVSIASFVSFITILLSIKNFNIKKKIIYIISLLFVIIIFFDNSRYVQTDYINMENNKILSKKKLVNNELELNELELNELELIEKNYTLALCDDRFNKIDAILSGRVCGWEILLKNSPNKDLFFGRGFFADQRMLRHLQKTSSNSWINILFNAGILAFIIVLLFIIIFLLKFFRIKNINDQNIYVSFSHYALIFILCRSLLEDTVAFINIDLLILFISLLIIKNKSKETKEL